MSDTLYLIRDKSTGLYWRGAKVLYSQIVRKAWTDSPAKARHFWNPRHVEKVWFGHMAANVEVVPFTLVEQTDEGRTA